MELTWHPGRPRPAPATPPARRDEATGLVAWVWPELDRPALDDEPCDGLGGPWCSSTWSRGRRSVRATWYPSGVRLARREGALVEYSLARDHDAALRRLIAAMVWLMESEGEGSRR